MNKTVFFLFFLFAGILLLANCLIYVPYPEGSPPQETYYRQENREYSLGLDISYFYDYLSPYGLWVYHPPHGYVWVPRVYRYGWRPYTHGRWIWTDYGWTWISAWEWGLIPFHYGRWSWNRYLGWYWVPDVIWGPAWVTWSWSSLYIGWAPLPPEILFVTGVGIPSGPFGFPDQYWIFVEYNNFYQIQLNSYVLPIERNETIVKTTLRKSNLVLRESRIVNQGVPIEDIRRTIGQPITEHRIRDAERASQPNIGGNVLTIYRPTVRKDDRAKPRTVVREEEAGERLRRLPARPAGETDVKADDSVFRERQEREAALLKESQEREISEMRKRGLEMRQKAADPKEKARIEEETRAKIERTREAHQTEEAKLKKRHTEEESKKEASKVKTKKKKKKLS